MQTARAWLAPTSASERVFPAPTCDARLSELPGSPVFMVFLLVRITHTISRGQDRRDACERKRRDGTDRRLDRVVGPPHR